jgi:hypothetical protein
VAIYVSNVTGGPTNRGDMSADDCGRGDMSADDCGRGDMSADDCGRGDMSADDCGRGDTNDINGTDDDECTIIGSDTGIGNDGGSSGFDFGDDRDAVWRGE